VETFVQGLWKERGNLGNIIKRSIRNPVPSYIPLHFLTGMRWIVMCSPHDVLPCKTKSSRLFNHELKPLKLWAKINLLSFKVDFLSFFLIVIKDWLIQFLSFLKETLHLLAVTFHSSLPPAHGKHYFMFSFVCQAWTFPINEIIQYVAFHVAFIYVP
jgi:hypothetical protein